MANEIDLNSIDLGKSDPIKYTANYVPANPPEPGTPCALPPGLQLDLTPTHLIPLNEACVYTFPDVIPIPPIYNPPQVKFTACETLNVETNVTTCPATSKSRLSLTAAGPTPQEDGGPADCSLALEGTICVEACEDFTATTNIGFGGAAAGSTLALSPRGRPDCGVDLTGYIDVRACEAFEAAANVSFSRAARNSNLALTAVSTPYCGVTLDGSVDVVACESYESQIAIQLGGKAVKSQSFSSSSTSIPNCGTFTQFSAIIDACTEVTVGGTVAVTGAASGSISLLSGGGDGCGVTLTGNIHVPKGCDSFEITGGNVTGGSVVVMGSDGAHLGTASVGGSVQVSSGSGGCSHKIDVHLGNASVTIPTAGDVTLIGGSAGAINSGGGGGGFGCAPPLITNLELNWLGVNMIDPPPSCCFNPCKGHIDMCAGDLIMNTIKVKNISTNTCGGGAGHTNLSFESSNLEFYLDDQSVASLTPNNLYLAGPGGLISTTISGGSVSVGTDCAGASLVQADYIQSTGCCNGVEAGLDLCGGSLYFSEQTASMTLNTYSLSLVNGTDSNSLTAASSQISGDGGVLEMSKSEISISSDGNNTTIKPGSIFIVGDGSINLTPPGKNCGFGKLKMCISEDATEDIYVLMCG